MAAAKRGILINHVGYNATGPKRAVLQSNAEIPQGIAFDVIYNSGQKVFSGVSHECGEVPGWKGRYFAVLEFSEFTSTGRFRIRAMLDNQELVSDVFRLEDGLMFSTLAEPAFRYFTVMRSFIDDRNVPLIDEPEKKRDVSGGWDDASGDTGKYLSHLSYSHYFNPQQTPMVVWSLLRSLEAAGPSFGNNVADMHAEAAWGADFLVRMFDERGFFYTNVFDRWGMNDKRLICAYKYITGDLNAEYQASFREGAGIAIAALSRASRDHVRGTYSPDTYLKVAEEAFAHLSEQAARYTSNGRDNIIDDCCALIAAVELWRSTGKSEYRNAADVRAKAIAAKQHNEGWFRVEENMNRPFFHGADEGLPIIALCEYMAQFGVNEQFVPVIRRAVIFYVSISTDSFNPFQYIRQYNSPFKDGQYGENRISYFLPHDNETGYWWQGENARLGSMATALLFAAMLIGERLKISPAELAEYADSQIDWILGCNPFNICMVCGFGYRDCPDLKGAASAKVRTNVVGGICNGITARDGDESDIDWMENEDNGESMAGKWRWAEQWLPHNSWFLLALSMKEKWRLTNGK